MIVFLSIFFAFAEPQLLVQQWMLPNQEVRQQGMQKYLVQHYGAQPPKVLEAKMVVVHWTGGETAKSAWNTFASSALGGRSDIKSGGDVNVSAHYLVDRDGTIFQLLPEDHFARHCIGVNHISIGIENVGGTSSTPLTTQQLDSNVALIKDLKQRHQIDVVIGHHEIKDFEEHPYFVETNPKYRSVKVDPGESFMDELRSRLDTSQKNRQGEPLPEDDPSNPLQK